MDGSATGTEGLARPRRAAGDAAPHDEAPPRAGPPAPAAPGCTVVAQWGARTWLGRAEDGAHVVCERVTVPPRMDGVDPRFLRQRAEELLATRMPALVPVRRILKRGTNVWMLSDVDGGVSLLRLLDRAKPSLAEAAAMAGLVLEAVAAMHDAGHRHHGLDSRSVRIGLDGTVRLAGWGPNALFPTGRDDDVRRADVRAAAGLVAEIAKAAGRPARPLTEREDRMATRLAAAADPRSLARRGLLKAAHGLDAAIGPSEARRAAHQRVVSLTRAVAAVDPPLPGLPATGPAPAGDEVLSAGVALAGASPARRPIPPPARRPPIWPRLWKGVAIGALVALVLGVELQFFGDKVSRNVHVLLSGSLRSAAAAGPRRPGPMPVLGPTAAGPVTHVELRPLDGCRAGGTCSAVVQVTVRPQAAPLAVPFSLEVLDRCRPGRESRPGGTLAIPPGRDRAFQTVTVPLPEGRAVAVIPLTSSPVVVAGTPLRTPGDDGPC